MTGDEQVLLEDWCQQFPSHSIGTVEFGPDGALYVTGGDGASFNVVEYGQFGNPKNPCGDPPAGRARRSRRPRPREGRCARRTCGRRAIRPASDGALLRIDPDTGEALPDNPNASSADPDTRRIVAYGLRNPFRFAFRPGTERGLDRRRRLEQLGGDRPPSPTPRAVENFGWPCFEGNGRQGGYDSVDLNLCESLYTSNAVRSAVLTRTSTRATSSRRRTARSAARRSPACSSPRPAARSRRSSTARCSSRTTRATASG